LIFKLPQNIKKGISFLSEIPFLFYTSNKYLLQAILFLKRLLLVFGYKKQAGNFIVFVKYQFHFQLHIFKMTQGIIFTIRKFVLKLSGIILV